MKLSSLVAASLPILLLGRSADAVRAPNKLAERPVEAAHGERARAVRFVNQQPPQAAKNAWSSFVSRHGAWRAIWDTATGVPLRVYGKGIDAPGSIASSSIAEQSARAVLRDEIGLLAPGARLDDIVPLANVLHGNGTMRTVTFSETRQGMPIVGATVSFLFKNDKLFMIGSTGAPKLDVRKPATVVARDRAEQVAKSWIASLYGGTPKAHEVGGVVALPLVHDARNGAQQLELVAVVPVTVDLDSPRGRWRVYVDGERGVPVAREQLLHFAQGTLRYRVGVRRPGGTKQDYAALYATHTIAGANVTADLAGLFTWAGSTSASVTAHVFGSYVAVDNSPGAEVSQAFTVNPGGAATWDLGTTERSDAQLASYVHANLIKEFARTTLAPSMTWLNTPLSVTVNESGNCNAYSTGDDIHFYVASAECENTGRLADVVYHEFGHSLHNHAIIAGAGSFDGALSEGVSDYLAATFVNDHGMGRGFFFNDEPLRDLDPSNGEKVYPDDLTGEVHNDGEIIGGALWDLRKGMIAALGDSAGRALADDFYYAILERASDIPSTYAEVLAADDDDGNLANGTPHKCIIDTAFSAHGLADTGSVASAVVEPPTLDGMVLMLHVGATTGACPPPEVQSARATWRLRSAPNTTGTVDFSGNADTLTATLPQQSDGQVVQYQVTVSFVDGTTTTFPNNAADPWYETYVGPVTEIFCTSFESDPTAEGWTLGNGFEWGAPAAAGNTSDPSSAYSGSSVIGIDLGGNGNDGNYDNQSTYSAQSPSIAIDGSWTAVRLQYRRWLSVEDATYDHATISADGTQLWQNLQTSAENTHHRDREWRFHDIDLTNLAVDGSVQLTFALDSDEALAFGGWAIDELCIVGVGAGSCGDGLLTSPEECDDGNTIDGDGCSADCVNEGGPDGPGPDAGGGDDDGNPEDGNESGGCCSAHDGGVGGPLVLGMATLLALRPRRRR